MKARKKLGLDKWKVQMDASAFLHICKQGNLELYDITIHQREIQFYTSVLQRHTIYRLLPKAVLLTTTGMLGYLLRSMVKPARLLSVVTAILIWYGLSSTIFEVTIKGEKDESRILIQKTLKQMGYTTPFHHQDENKLKEALKKKLENEIAWLEIEKRGSRYIITYTPKEFATLETLHHRELIAKQDGVIARFDIQHGNKVHKVNEFVHKGDVLVSNVIADSKSKNQEVYVKGRVFAYTWRDVTVSMDDTKMPKAFQYFELLMAARAQVSQDFHKDDKIHKENILQFSKDMGKIKMVIHYTLLQDITTP